MDEAAASRAALQLLDAGYTKVHVVSGGLQALLEETLQANVPALEREAEKQGLPRGRSLTEALERSLRTA